jgi:hypothetical protein
MQGVGRIFPVPGLLQIAHLQLIVADTGIVITGADIVIQITGALVLCMVPGILFFQGVVFPSIMVAFLIITGADYSTVIMADFINLYFPRSESV